MTQAAFMCFTKAECERLVTALEVAIELIGNEDEWFGPLTVDQFYPGYEAADEFQTRIIEHFKETSDGSA